MVYALPGPSRPGHAEGPDSRRGLQRRV